MARVVEDSDDEFPDLATLVKNVKVAPKPAATTSKAPSATSRDIVRDGASSSSSTRKVVPSNREKLSSNDGKDEEKEVVAKEIARLRKRVLNQKNDNPLLRPLSSAPLSRASSEVSDRSFGVNSKEKVAKEVGRSAPMSEQTAEAPRQNVLREESLPMETKHIKDKESKKPNPKEKRRLDPCFDSDEDGDHGSDGMSDFIVDDSTFLDDESVIEAPPPRSVRRLVKGRKPMNKVNSDDEDLDLKLGKLTVKDDPFAESRDVSLGRYLEDFADSYNDEVPPPFKLPEKFSKNQSKKDQAPAEKATTSGSDMENPFTLRFSPPNPKSLKVTKETRFETPPGSPEPDSKPKPRTLGSPKKLPRIPATPHRPSMDAFWQQDVINDWNDEYSPRKTPAARPKLLPSDSTSNILFSPKKSPTKQEDKAAKEAKKAFSDIKHALAESFLKELDAAITNNQVSTLAASTGGIKILWSKKLNTTAGRANWKRETLHPKSSTATSSSAPMNTKVTYRHHATIELAEKVIDDEHRLLNVLAHEYCHLANFMVSNIKNNPHGKEFKAWAAKTSKLFGHRGVEVTTKHSYEIDYRYVWTCVNVDCAQEFKRHSKSIDPKRHQCGVCKGRLVQTKPVPRGNGTGDMNTASGKEGEKKGLSEYQLFVKENMRKVKEDNPGSPQKEIMSLVGKRYQEFKASKLSKVKESESVSIDIEGDVLSKEGTPEDEVLLGVVRKLDFLDLTSSP